MGKKQAFNPISNKFDFINELDNPLQFKGNISVNTEFPLVADVLVGWFYTVSASVTDDAGVLYTNTGLSFVSGDEIAWNGVNWSLLGSIETNKVKYDISDPVAGYVSDKVVAGTGISLAEGTGANENKLLITNSDLGSSAVTTHEVTYDHSLIATALQSETDPLSLHLDQTTPQTITGGIPLLTNLTPSNDYDISTKKYVDDTVGDILTILESI